MTVRQPAVAGKFYTDHPGKLAESVEEMLSIGKLEHAPGHPRILIVPHAGYMYSGQTAATGFADIGDVTRIILLGVSHHEYFNNAALYQGGFWQTPLGQVAIDLETVEKLAQSDHFTINNYVHLPEHGLEVQLPFLQRRLADFKIVPILLSQAQNDIIDHIARTLADLMDDRTLLIVSSDLSHYPNQKDAESVDRQTIDAILSGDILRLDETIKHQMKSHIPGLSTCACGATAIKVGMRVAGLLNLTDARLLQYTNSGQVSGMASRVVGYATLSFGN